MFRAAIFASLLVCLSHALISIPGSNYAPIPETEAAGWESLPTPTLAQDCPNGMCPMPSSVVPVATSVVYPSVTVVGSPHSRGEWSYPGDVYSHLMSDHGIDATNMSFADAERLHSSLHVGRTATTVTRTTSRTYVVGQPIRNVVRMQPVRSIIRAQPIRSVIRAQPVRSVVRRVFCR